MALQCAYGKPCSYGMDGVFPLKFQGFCFYPLMYISNI